MAPSKHEKEFITDLYSLANYRMVKHEQLETTAPNRVVVTVEHCADCAKHHASTTRHDEGKYSGNAEAVKDAIMAAFPFIEVHVKPTTSLKLSEAPQRADGRPGWVREKGSDQISERHPAGFSMPGEEAYRSERLGASRELLSHRLGACEVQVGIFPPEAGATPTKKLLHSKLATRAWPQNAAIVAKLTELLRDVARDRLVRVKAFDYVNDEQLPAAIPAGVKLEAAAGELKYSADVPEGPPAKDGGFDPQGADLFLTVPMLTKTIDFPGSETLCKSSLAIGPTQEAADTPHLVELHTKPRLTLDVKPPAAPGYGSGAGTLLVTKGADFKASLPFGETGARPPDACC